MAGTAQPKSAAANAKKPKPSAGQDAIELLKADHQEVAEMFEAFEADKLDDDGKQELAQKICDALSVHAQIEEEIFYPAARDALGADDENLLDEAEVEHGSIKDLVEALEGHIDDELFEAQVKVMGEWVKHHVKEEETEMFPKLQETDMDMSAIGAQLAERKAELMAEIAESDDDSDDSDEGEEANEEGGDAAEDDEK